MFIPKSFLVLALRPGAGRWPGSHSQGWCSSIPLAGQGEVEKKKPVLPWPSASLELIFLPLAGSAPGVDEQATHAGQGTVRVPSL